MAADNDRSIASSNCFQIFMAAGCELGVAEIDDKGSVKTSTVPFNETFFTGYRRNVVTPNQVTLLR